jgi:putative RNA 2'-phosphotransferase
MTVTLRHTGRVDETRLVRASKRLSLHLRHAPGDIGLTLDRQGWVSVDALLDALGSHGLKLSRTELDEVVARNDKERFAFDESATRIRASQGHSTPVQLDLPVASPPPVLFHGTVQAALTAIAQDGLRPMGRHDVHLSTNQDTAIVVGARHGRPIVLRVDAAAMERAGYEFRISANGVWLTAHVPPQYLSGLSAAG